MMSLEISAIYQWRIFQTYDTSLLIWKTMFGLFQSNLQTSISSLEGALSGIMVRYVNVHRVGGGHSKTHKKPIIMQHQ